MKRVCLNTHIWSSSSLKNQLHVFELFTLSSCGYFIITCWLQIRNLIQRFKRWIAFFIFSSPPLRKARALYACKAEHDSELSFIAGTVFQNGKFPMWGGGLFLALSGCTGYIWLVKQVWHFSVDIWYLCFVPSFAPRQVSELQAAPVWHLTPLSRRSDHRLMKPQACALQE